MSPSKPAPTPADLQTASSFLPDRPNVAPSPREHEVAAGQNGQRASGNASSTPAPSSDTPGMAGSMSDGAGAAEAAQADGADGADRESRIRSAAYDLASKRGFAPGRDVDDWLDAERQIDEADGPDGARVAD